MSLQPGINPLDKFGTVGSRRGSSPIDKFGTVYGPGPGQHYSFPTAEEMERRMKERTTGGIPNMGGFDPGDLMAAPKLRQDATMNQANMVSSPYFEANEKAAEKTNPMNAASQEPGRSFLMKYIGK